MEKFQLNLDTCNMSTRYNIISKCQPVTLANRLISQFCRHSRRGGGSGIFVRDMLRTRQVHYLSRIAQEKTFELSAVELLDIIVVIVCIYRSPDSDID
jgi:hypothetical protein